MSAPRIETRIALMALVEVSWEGEDGTRAHVSASMENRSASGACIRLRKPISVGARVKIRRQWEEFSGFAVYCRRDRMEYVVGMKRNIEANFGSDVSPTSGKLEN